MIRPLSNQLQTKAETELNECTDRIQDDLKHIREWLEKQPHLNVRKDEQWLIGFLRGCKFSLQRVKKKLDYFYTIRTLMPEYFTNRDPLLPEIQEILKASCFIPLPKTKDQAGPRIILFRWEACNVGKMLLVDLMKVFFMILDILINEDDNCVVSGIYIWPEFKKFPLTYILQFTPSFVKKTVLCLENAYPMRIKGIHCTNAPAAFESVFNLAKTFMNEKLKNRMFLYSEATTTNVYKHMPQYLMPKEYGGDGGFVDELAVTWRTKVESYRDWYLEDAKFCSEEKLRVGEPRTSAEMFGVEGTFRKLSID